MSLSTKAVLHAATYPRDPRPGTPCNITIAQFNDWLAEEHRQAKADGFDEGVRASGLDLDYILQLLDNNPYRSQK